MMGVDVMGIKELEEHLEGVSSRLNEDTRFKYINISMSDKQDMVGICCEVCDLYSNIHRSTLVDKTDKVKNESIEKWIDYTLNSITIVNELNEFMKQYQEDSGNTLRVMYKWGNNEKNCKILDWNTNRIVIKLSKNALQNLILYSDEFKNTIIKCGYSSNLCNYVSKFNGEECNKIIGAELSSNNIMEELSKYMISTVDVMNNIMNDKDTSNKTIKSIFKIEELDIISNITWKISNKSNIKVDVDVDKIVDTSNNKIIRSEKLYNSVKCLLEYEIQRIQEDLMEGE